MNKILFKYKTVHLKFLPLASKCIGASPGLDFCIDMDVFHVKQFVTKYNNEKNFIMT